MSLWSSLRQLYLGGPKEEAALAQSVLDGPNVPTPWDSTESLQRDRSSGSSAGREMLSSDNMASSSPIARGKKEKKLSDIDAKNWKELEQERVTVMMRRVSGFWGICSACNKIDLERGGQWYHHNVTNLRSSAWRGCPICAFINTHSIPKSYGEVSRDSEIHLDISKGLLEYKLPGRLSMFELFRNNSGSMLVPSDPTSPESLATVKGWLHQCMTEHKGCTLSASVLQRDTPTRLIDVEASPPRLCTQTPPDAHYAILSYCWGSKKFLNTTNANVRDHEKALPMKDLPATTQHAIKFTKLLGIRYLWIDALCIVQDNPSHWSVESQKMASYYRDAYITLSALEAGESQAGFLSRRAKIPHQSFPSNPKISIRPLLEQATVKFQRAPLNKRAWALQERLLSTRVLHFTSDGFFWECQTSSASETAPHMSTVQQTVTDLVFSEGQNFKRALASRDSETGEKAEDPFTLWQHLVRQFTRRSITYTGDKLPAISGLAAVIADRASSEYLAGIWKDNPEGLLWFRDSHHYLIEHQDAVVGLAGSRGPSWSWASQKTSVLFRFEDDKQDLSVEGLSIRASIKSSELEIEGVPPYGRAKSGFITIRARTKVVTSVGREYTKLASESLPDRVYAADVGKPGEIIQIGTAMLDSGESNTINIEFHEQQRDILKAVQISQRLRTNVHEHGGSFTNTVSFFLLVALEDAEKNTWRRIGAGMTSDVPQICFESAFSDAEWEELVLV